MARVARDFLRDGLTASETATRAALSLLPPLGGNMAKDKHHLQGGKHINKERVELCKTKEHRTLIQLAK
jgi:hypothetical protein